MVGSRLRLEPFQDSLIPFVAANTSECLGQILSFQEGPLFIADLTKKCAQGREGRQQMSHVLQSGRYKGESGVINETEHNVPVGYL